MDRDKIPHVSSVAGCRQQLIQTLSLILDQERQWLAELEKQHNEAIKPMIDYMTEHINILGDSISAMTSGKYRSLSVHEGAIEAICKDIVSYTEFVVAVHQRACTGLNQALVAKEVTTIKFLPVSRYY